MHVYSTYSTLTPAGLAYPTPSGTSELGCVSNSLDVRANGHHASDGLPLHASCAPHAGHYGHLHMQLAQQHGGNGCVGYMYAGMADVGVTAPDEQHLSRCGGRDGAPASHHGHGMHMDVSTAVAYAAAAAAGHPGSADDAALGKPAKRARNMMTPAHHVIVHNDCGMPDSVGCEAADPRLAPHHAHSRLGLRYADCKPEQYEVHELGVRYSADRQGSGVPERCSSDGNAAAAATSDTAHNLLTLATLAECCNGAGIPADRTDPQANHVTGRVAQPCGGSGRPSRRQASPSPQHEPYKAGAVSGHSAFQATEGRGCDAFKALGPPAPAAAATTFSGHSEDNSEPPLPTAKAQACHTGTGTGARNRTKNQEAQARFRTRRKAMLADLKSNVVDLKSRVRVLKALGGNRGSLGSRRPALVALEYPCRRTLVHPLHICMPGAPASSLSTPRAHSSMSGHSS